MTLVLCYLDFVHPKHVSMSYHRQNITLFIFTLRAAFSVDSEADLLSNPLGS